MNIDPRIGLPDSKSIFSEIAREYQKIKVTTVSRRYGKIATLVSGFDKNVDIKSIAKSLKEQLACGGTIKDGIIELQGNHKKQVKPILIKQGFLPESIDDD